MATETLIIATPAKLQDGSWGVRFTVDVRLSKDILAGWASEWSTNPWVVRVQTKAGKQWEARVSGILSCRKDKADKTRNSVLASTKPHQPTPAAAPVPATPRQSNPSRGPNRPIFRKSGICGCGEVGVLYGRYEPGMCSDCWDERYS